MCVFGYCVSTTGLFAFAAVLTLIGLTIWANLRDKKSKQDKEPTRVVKEEVSLPPFRVGQTTDLIQNKVDFEVSRIKETDKYDLYPWIAYGKAIVTLPAGATAVEIEPVVDKNGNITDYVVHYEIANKKRTIATGKSWLEKDNDGKPICRFEIQEVEEK